MKKIILVAIPCLLLASCNVLSQKNGQTNDKSSISNGGNAIKNITLLGANLLPESCNINAKNGDLYVGSSADGSVQKIVGDNSTMFLPAGTEGLTSLSGLAVDAVNNRLWVLNTDMQNPMSGKTGVRVFDLTSKKLLKSWNITDKNPHQPNDIVLDKNGNAYFTDSFSPTIWWASSKLDKMEAFVTDNAFTLDPKSFNLNGIDLTPNKKFLIATVINAEGKLNNGDGYLFRIDLATKKAHYWTFLKTLFFRPFNAFRTNVMNSAKL
jgi:DNA-binding beta-propeller fold protein YncE